MSRTQEIILCLAGLLAVFFIYPLAIHLESTHMGSFDWGFERFRFVLLAAIVGRLLLECTPTVWRLGPRNAVLIFSLAVLLFNHHKIIFMLFVFLNIVFLTLILLVLPLHKRNWRSSTIFFGTLYVPVVLVAVILPFQVPNFYNFLLLAPVISFLMITGALMDFEQHKPKAAIICAMCTNFVGRGPVPLDECMEVRMESILLWKGLLFLSMGVILLGLNIHFQFVISYARSVIGDLSIENILIALGIGFAAWFFFFFKFAALLFLNCGLLLVLGFPLRNPIRNPWLATNFVEYWQRVSVYRAEFFRRIYLPYLVRCDQPKIYLGIIAIFMFTYLLHFWDLQMKGSAVLIWFLEGTVTAVTIYWLQWRNTQQLSNISDSAPKRKINPTNANRKRVSELLLNFLFIFLTLTSQGLLFIFHSFK